MDGSLQLRKQGRLPFGKRRLASLNLILRAKKTSAIAIGFTIDSECREIRGDIESVPSTVAQRGKCRSWQNSLTTAVYIWPTEPRRMETGYGRCGELDKEVPQDNPNVGF